MKEWYLSLQWFEHVYLWLGVASTLFLIVQIILMCVSSFGGDVDLDGDGEIDVDADSGVSIFTTKSITAFFAVGSWTGLLVCALASDKLQWLSIIIAIIAGLIAATAVVLLMRAIMKLQSNGILETEKLIGKRAVVYVTIPASRGGRGKITLDAQGKFMELDAMTEDGEKLACDTAVEITATEGECAIVRKV